MAEFTINGIAIKNPSSFKIERYNVTNMERIANGDMVGDLVSKKIKLFFTYEAITAGELDNILDAIWEHNELFFPVAYTYNGKQKTIRAYVGSIPSELHSAKSKEWVWKNVTFNLIQQ